MERWEISPILRCRLQWGAIRGNRRHECSTCGIPLLTGEKSGFCCGPNGSKFHDVPILPEMPSEFHVFLDHPHFSKFSRVLNLIFSFASLETTHAFPDPSMSSSFVAIQGKVYHRIRPNHSNSVVRWLLYDGFMDDNIPHSNWASQLPKEWITATKAALLRVNPFIHSLALLSSLPPNIITNATLTLTDANAQEMAAIVSYDNTTISQVKPRAMIIRTNSDQSIYIHTTSRLWEPLSYPLLFPHGTLGWGLTDNTHVVETNENEEQCQTTQIWHYRARLLREPRFQIMGRLCGEYIVDMFSREMDCRLSYIRNNQNRIKQDDYLLMDSDVLSDSENVYLPASFLGSCRWVSEQIADSLTIAAYYGAPTFFITMTCNPLWPEITSQLHAGQDFSDVPVVVTRVFKRKLTVLLDTLKTMFPNVGHPIYDIHVIEFQKRGLPHAHILIKYPFECITATDINQVCFFFLTYLIFT